MGLVYTCPAFTWAEKVERFLIYTWILMFPPFWGVAYTSAVVQSAYSKLNWQSKHIMLEHTIVGLSKDHHHHHQFSEGRRNWRSPLVWTVGGGSQGFWHCHVCPFFPEKLRGYKCSTFSCLYSVLVFVCLFVAPVAPRHAYPGASQCRHCWSGPRLIRLGVDLILLPQDPFSGLLHGMVAPISFPRNKIARRKSNEKWYGYMTRFELWLVFVPK